MATSTATAKRCMNCHRDVTTGKRMKDSSGRYWCIPCGTADQKKKAGGGGAVAEPCGQCGDRFPASKLSKWGGVKLCVGCVKARTKGPGLKAAFSGGGGGSDAKRTKMMVGVMAVLGLLSLGHYVFHFPF
jgi:hypothetical protein